MSTTERTAAPAQGWIEARIRMDLDRLAENLAPDFVHTSPAGRLAGREHYLATVEPSARKSVREPAIEAGPIPTCDWVRVENDRIAEARSFYDPGAVRDVLADDEQGDLSGR